VFLRVPELQDLELGIVEGGLAQMTRKVVAVAAVVVVVAEFAVAVVVVVVVVVAAVAAVETLGGEQE